MRTYTLLIANFFLVICFLFGNVQPLFAQLTREASTAVTAVVIDRLAPSTPILISPVNDSRLKNGTVTFTWQASTDNWLMDHYTLKVNDSILFDSIPLDSTTTADYTLVYDPATQYYSLTPSNTLADGNYIWSVTAHDYHKNQSSSVTWEFTIDTLAPIFTITEIENQTVEITTGDAESVPEEPIALEENEPTLSGTGEANSTVVLTITLPDDTQREMTFTIGHDGKWSITLESLPRDALITLDFLITDPTGNVSILSDVRLILYTPVIIIPIPSGVPGGQPNIEIPVIPPLEHIPPIIKNLPKKAVFYVRNYAVQIQELMVTGISKLWLFIALLLSLALPLLKLSLLIGWYRNYLSSFLFKQFLWIIGWWREQNPQGIVVEANTQAPVPHSLVLISGKNTAGLTEKIELISNEAGVFPTFTVPDGEYRISIQHPGYFFPTLRSKPTHLDWYSYYVGRAFTLKSGKAPFPFVLPVEPLERKQHIWLYELRKAILLAPSLNVPLSVLIGSISLAYPSAINLLTLIFYIFLLARKKIQKHKKNTALVVVDTEKNPVQNVVVAIQPKDSTTVKDIAHTNEEGLLKLQLPPDVYKVWCIDFKQRLTEGDNKTATAFSTDASNNYLALVLKKG